MTEDTGFFRSLRGLATDWVTQKRKSLQTEPLTDVDSAGGKGAYSFQGQDLSFDDLREIKDMRDSGGQVAALMQSKALLNFGEGAEIEIEDNEDTAQTIQGTEMTLKEWLELRFPELDLTVLDLGKDALWYPYAVGEHLENRAGQYKEFLPAEPYTILPETDDKGEIVRWHQRTQSQGGYTTKVLQPDEIEAIILNKSCARDKTGISEVLRNKEEIQAFRENEQAIQQAIELHGFPQRHVRVGREDGAPVRDDELRRVRNIFDPRNTDANTAYFTGQDVNVDTIEAENFDYQAVHEMSTRKLTTALGMPLEAGNVGSDGLGSGKPAELRFSMLKLQIKANQRAFATQFVEKVLRPVVRDYSPFSHTADISLEIDDPLEDIGDMADVINKVGDYLTNAEIRRKLDLPEPEDDEIAEGYRSPADIEAPEDQNTGGLFGSAPNGDRDFRSLDTPQGVPDNANPISDRSECDGQVVTGDRGGLYCVPQGEDMTPDNIDGVEDIPEDGFSDEELEAVVDDVTPDADDIRDGDVNAENVEAMKKALPDEFDDSVFWEQPEDDKPIPSKGQPLAVDGDMVVMDDIESIGDDGLPDELLVQTSDGEATIEAENVSHVFNEDADPTPTDGDQEVDDITDTTDPDEFRNSVSQEPDVSNEVDEYVEGADNAQTVGASFEDEISIVGVSEEEIIEGDADPPSFSTAGANSTEQAEEFTESVVKARERGWLDNVDGAINLPDNNLNLPEGAQGTFKPGVRNFTGEKIRDTDERKAQININPDANEEWDGEQEYIPFGPDEASKMEYAVNHEFGHSEHYNNLIEQRDLTVDEIESDEFQRELQDEMREHSDAIEEEFSALAAKNPFEFAADTFSALSVGADVSDEVLEAYDKIGGVAP